MQSIEERYQIQFHTHEGPKDIRAIANSHVVRNWLQGGTDKEVKKGGGIARPRTIHTAADNLVQISLYLRSNRAQRNELFSLKERTSSIMDEGSRLIALTRQVPVETGAVDPFKRIVFMDRSKALIPKPHRETWIALQNLRNQAYGAVVIGVSNIYDLRNNVTEEVRIKAHARNMEWYADRIVKCLTDMAEHEVQIRLKGDWDAAQANLAELSLVRNLYKAAFHEDVQAYPEIFELSF